MTDLPYRLCALDLDDTLLGPTQQISPRNIAAVRAVAALGVTVVLASGRMHESMQQYAEQIGLEGPLISYNGAMVRPVHEPQPWLHESVDGEKAAVILDYCRDHHLQLNYYRDNCIYTAAMNHWIELYQRRTNAPLKVLPDFYDALRGLPSTKLVIIDAPEKVEILKPHFATAFGSSLYITTTADEYLEFMPPTASKGAALQFLTQQLGLAPADVIAFGDGHNDIPMITWAGMGVAMGNAKTELKNVSDRVIGNSDADGIAIALEEIFSL